MSKITLNKLKALGLSSGTRECPVEDLKWTRYELNRLTEQLIIDFDKLERQLEVYKSIAEEAIEVTPAHFDEGYGWSESIDQLEEKGE